MQDYQDFKMPEVKLPDNIRGLVIGGIIVIAVISALASGFYTIEAEEVGIVLRFGKHIDTVEPGLHTKIPFGIDQVIPVPTQRNLKVEFGYRTVAAGVRSQFATRGFEEEALMLTGDLNIASVEWAVQYQIRDPEKFLFRVRRVEGTLRAASETVMREVVGDRSVNEVLTTGRTEVGVEVKAGLQKMMDQYDTGVDIVLVQLQPVNPPDAVKPSFNAVNQATQEMKRIINEAESEYQKAIPRASGEAQQMIQTAEGYAMERVNRAKGEAKRFIAVQGEYVKAKEVTRKRLYLETMREILPKVGRKIIIDENQKGILPFLDLAGKEVPR